MAMTCRATTRSVLLGLLHAQTTAVESYDRALEAVEPHADQDWLEGFRRDHAEAVSALRGLLFQFPGGPSATAPTAEGARFGHDLGAAASERARVGILASDEERCAELYEQAIANPAVDPQVRKLVRTTLFPRCHTHLELLTRMMAAAWGPRATCSGSSLRMSAAALAG